MKPTVTHSVDSDGVGWLVFDDPVARANVFTPAVFADLRAAVAALAAQPVKAVVVWSAKERIFIAGADLKWLSKLRRGPLRPLGPQVLCVHGAPKYEDRYIRYESDARFALKASRARITFFGHTHLQGCWFSQGRDLTGVKPDFPSTNGTVRFEVALHKIHRYLMNPGSVGQPRDGDWRAAFAVFDDAEPMLTLFRVPYDVAIAQQRILWAGLPDALATRLQQGR